MLYGFSLSCSSTYTCTMTALTGLLTCIRTFSIYETHHLCWWTRIGSTDPEITHIYCSFSLLAQRKRASCGLCHTTTESAPVPLCPSDCPVLLEAAGILKTRFAQTVGVFAYLKIPFGSFCGARQVPMGKATLLRCNTPPFRGAS